NGLGRLFAAALALALVGWLPSRANALTVVFTNNCNRPIAIQAATVIRGVLKREQPYLLKVGQSTPKISITVDKIIMIYDGKSNRMLFKDVLKRSLQPLRYKVTETAGKIRVLPDRKMAAPKK